jgi:hypothetical protein
MYTVSTEILFYAACCVFCVVEYLTLLKIFIVFLGHMLVSGHMAYVMLTIPNSGRRSESFSVLNPKCD